MTTAIPERAGLWPRAIAWAYTVALTYGLVASAPLAILGGPGDAAQEAIDRSLAGAVQHIVAYAGLAWLWCRVHRGRSRWLWVGALAVAHGLATEVIQLFVPRRECDWFDMLANVGGVLAGIGLARLLRRRAVRRPPSAREATAAGAATG
ncbi:MAG TPA: VanZ family protein [Planctomycetaceae bacterium]|nr:VanZ family protein [Planctomycetaceae bacterium]